MSHQVLPVDDMQQLWHMTGLQDFFCESWRVPHVGQDMLTLIRTPDFTPFGEFIISSIHCIYITYICQSTDYVYRSMKLIELLFHILDNSLAICCVCLSDLRENRGIDNSYCSIIAYSTNGNHNAEINTMEIPVWCWEHLNGEIQV